MERKLNFFETEIKKEKEEMLIEKGKSIDDLEAIEQASLSINDENSKEQKTLSMDEMEVADTNIFDYLL
jgi:hypothetical protein